MPTTECQHCGATIQSQGARFCEFCGTELVREGAPRLQTRDEAQKTRFDLLHSHPELQRWMGHTPDVPPAVSLGSVALLLPVLGVFAVVAFFFLSVPGPSGFGFVPFMMLVFVGAVLLSKGANAAKYRSAPLVRRTAIVVDERTKVSGGGKNFGAHTRYYVTLETSDGRREEFRVDERLAGNLTEGDAGVAYLKHDVLIAFQRLSV